MAYKIRPATITAFLCGIVSQVTIVMSQVASVCYCKMDVLFSTDSELAMQI